MSRAFARGGGSQTTATRYALTRDGHNKKQFGGWGGAIKSPDSATTPTKEQPSERRKK